MIEFNKIPIISTTCTEFYRLASDSAWIYHLLPFNLMKIYLLIEEWWGLFLRVFTCFLKIRFMQFLAKQCFNANQEVTFIYDLNLSRQEIPNIQNITSNNHYFPINIPLL